MSGLKSARERADRAAENIADKQHRHTVDSKVQKLPYVNHKEEYRADQCQEELPPQVHWNDVRPASVCTFELNGKSNAVQYCEECPELAAAENVYEPVAELI